MPRLFVGLSSALALAGLLAIDGESDCLSAMQMPMAAAKLDAASSEVCRAMHLVHHLPPSLTALPAGAVQPKVFDFFLFGFPAEVPVLELRLAEMADSVDGIFIVEADKDFQGHPREMLLRTMLQEEPLRSYADKLFIIEVHIPEISPDRDEFGGTYNIQLAINNMIYVAGDVVGAMPGADISRDMLIMSDLDEIVGRRALAALKQCTPATDSPSQWPLMMTDMDYFQDGFRHRQFVKWDKSPILGPVSEVVGFRRRPVALASHSIFDGAGRPIEAAALGSSISFFKETPEHDVSTKGKGVYHPTDVMIATVDRSKATGWHMSWALSDEGTARKLHARAGGLPTWAQGMSDEELVREVHHRRVTSTPLFNEPLGRVFNDARRLPDAVRQDPERFQSFLPDHLFQHLRRLERLH